MIAYGRVNSKHEFMTIPFLPQSNLTKKLIAVLLGLTAVAALIFGTSRWLAGRTAAGMVREKEQLQQQLVKKTDEYNQDIGMAKARELAAREDALKANALVEEYKRRMGTVAALDKKIQTAEEQYESNKASLGDCTDDDDCLSRLRAELCRAGFKKACD